MHCWIRIGALFLSLGVPALAFAEPPVDTRKLAEEQFYRGRDLANKGNCKRALEFFRTSQSLEPNRGKLLNIATCEEQLGQLATALRHFEELVPQFPAKDERLAIVKAHIAALTPRVPHVRIELAPGAPSGTVIMLDDLPVADSSLGTAMRIDPGDHTVTVRAPGVPDRQYPFRSEPAKSLTLAVAAGTRGELSQSPPAGAPASPGHGMRVAGWVVGGVGLASVGVGSVTGIMALVKHAALTKDCSSPAGCSKDASSMASTGKALSLTSTAAFAVGLASVGVGTFLVLWSGRKKAGPTVEATVLPGGGGLRLEGRF